MDKFGSLEQYMAEAAISSMQMSAGWLCWCEMVQEVLE